MGNYQAQGPEVGYDIEPSEIGFERRVRFAIILVIAIAIGLLNLQLVSIYFTYPPLILTYFHYFCPFLIGVGWLRISGYGWRATLLLVFLGIVVVAVLSGCALLID